MYNTVNNRDYSVFALLILYLEMLWKQTHHLESQQFLSLAWKEQLDTDFNMTTHTHTSTHIIHTHTNTDDQNTGKHTLCVSCDWTAVWVCSCCSRQVSYFPLSDPQTIPYWENLNMDISIHLTELNYTWPMRCVLMKSSALKPGERSLDDVLRLVPAETLWNRGVMRWGWGLVKSCRGVWPNSRICVSIAIFWSGSSILHKQFPKDKHKNDIQV